MSESDTQATQATSGAEPVGAQLKDAAPVAGPQPLRPLPSTRTKFDTQLLILRAFAAASGPTKRPAQNADVANASGVNISTVSSCNRFFADVGLIEQQGRGYVPAQAVYDFQLAHSWNPDTAAHKLAGSIEQSWIWETIGGRLSIRSLTDDEVTAALADAVKAPPAFRASIEIIIEFLIAVGLVERDAGGLLKRSNGAHLPTPKPSEKPAGESASKDAAERQAPKPQREPEHEAPLSNSMSLSMKLVIPMDKVSRLGDPQKVQDFFTEWANLVNAKTAIEKMMAD